MTKLNLPHLRDPAEEAQAVKERGKQAASARKSAEETTADALARILTLKLTDKERALVELAREAYSAGRIGRLKDGRLAKAEAVEMGRRIHAEDESAKRKERAAETLRTKPANYHVIVRDADLPRMIERLREEVRRQQDDAWFMSAFRAFNDTLIRRKLTERGIDIPAAMSLTVWDTETSGTDTYNDLTGGYSVWLPLLNEGYYVAYGHTTGETQCTRSKALAAIERFISLPAHIKSFHNAEFDIAVMQNDGLTPRGVRYDSMDAQRILYDHENSYGLKPLFTKYKSAIGANHLDDFTFEDLFGDGSPLVHPVEVVGIYAIKDVEKGWLLTRWQIDMLRQVDDLARAYFEIRQYLPEVNTCIQRTGFVIDLDGLAELSREYRPKLERAKRAIFDAYGIDDEFIRRMDRTINANKIDAWVTAQAKRIERKREQIRKKRAQVAEYERKDKTHLKAYAQAREQLAKYERELAEMPPAELTAAPTFVDEFNLASDAHVQYLIYDHLGIKDRTKDIVKDKSRRRAVSKDVLDVYFDEEPTLKPLADYSKYEKLLGTYVEKIPDALEADGRLHTSLGTVSTGRYGSSGYSGKPVDGLPAKVTDDNYLATIKRLIDAPNKSVPRGTNVQNIPSRNEEGLRVRRCFVPASGYTFVGSDLSSIEPRIQAHIMAVEFGDETFAEMYRQGRKPYEEFASILFDVPIDQCAESYYDAKRGTADEVPPYRKIMKQLFLAIGYGQAFPQFYKSVMQYGIDEEHARKAYAKFDEVLPGFKRMVEAAFEHLRAHGWTATIFGQKRRFPEYQRNWRRLCELMQRADIDGKNDPELRTKVYRLKRYPGDLVGEFWDLLRKTGRDERAAFNHRIQGSGANILQACMIRSYYELVLARGWEFNLTLHDEMKHSAPNEQLTPEAIALYDDIMTNTVTLELPLACDSVIEPRWMDEVRPDEWFKQRKGA